MESEKRKKILFVITKSVWGGAGKYVYDLATSLPKDAFDVSVTFGGTGPLSEKLIDAGIRTIPIVTLRRDISIVGDVLSFFELIKTFRKEKPDIVHVNSSKAGGIGALAARFAKVPQIIFTCHGWAFNEERSSPSLFLIRIASWLTVLFSHATIAVSTRDYNDGKAMPFVGDKVALVHNGVHEPEFLIRSEAKKAIAGFAKEVGIKISKTSILIGTIGELHKNKGYEYFIRAFAKIKDEIRAQIMLVIMGEGEERENLEKLIKSLNLQSDVALLGFIKDAPNYLKAFDVFALTSIKEGLPYVIIEAGYAALPVVATNVGGVKEIIEDMKSGVLVQTRKPDDIAQGMKFLLTEPDKVDMFAKNLRDKVSNEFSLEQMVEKTVAVYKN
jgi:glycosyltransferase involved in cell wall biosynthesis